MADDGNRLPVLLTRRLCLRAPTETDIPAWYARATDRESAFLAGDPIPADISEGLAWLQRTRHNANAGARLLWTIDVHDGPQSVGTVGLSLRTPGISFVIGRPYWGQGYATEAAREVLRHAFDTLDLSSVGSEYVKENKGSRRVHEKLGFRHVEDFTDPEDGARCERLVLARNDAGWRA